MAGDARGPRATRASDDHLHHAVRHLGTGRPAGRQGPDRHGGRAQRPRAAAPWRRAPCRRSAMPRAWPAHGTPARAIVGRTNLHELALGVTGINPWYGTPVNPLDPDPRPGGSSSGSAVAVATGEADVAYGSDTGGSVRIPAACCGTAGLKTTWGRIPLGRRLAPLARASTPSGRWRVTSPDWSLACNSSSRPSRRRTSAGATRIEVARLTHRGRSRHHRGHRSGPRARRLAEPGPPGAGLGRGVDPGRPAPRRRGVAPGPRWLLEPTPTGSVRASAPASSRLRLSAMPSCAPAWETQRAWAATLERVFTHVDFLVTPTLTIFPPPLDDGDDLLVARCTLPVNLAGVPALSLPVPTGGPFPASLQLIGPLGERRALAGGRRTPRGGRCGRLTPVRSLRRRADPEEESAALGRTGGGRKWNCSVVGVGRRALGVGTALLPLAASSLSGRRPRGAGRRRRRTLSVSPTIVNYGAQVTYTMTVTVGIESA